MDRKYATRINYLIENFLPPVLADRALVGRLLNFAQGKGFKLDWEFDEHDSQRGSRPRDYSAGQEAFVLEALQGDSVLEIGSGRGLLLRKIEQLGFTVRGFDPHTETDYPAIERTTLQQAALPDRSWDTVISLHTLEHLPDCRETLAEMRRVARRRVVVVVPRQRYRKFTYDSHIHFFPDQRQLLQQLGIPQPDVLKLIDRDWCFYLDGPA